MDSDALLHRVRAEFLEMPGLRLTPEQAARLWSLEPAVCLFVIDALVGARFLRRTPAGAVMRADQ